MIRIPLDNAYNVRDLGYYGASDGKMTRNRTFLRGDGICNLSEADVNRLISYGVETVIDLRSGDEVAQMSNSFLNHSVIKYYNIGVLDGVYQKDFPRISAEDDSLGVLYVFMLNNCKDKIASVFKIIASSMNGCTLFHCKAGKDRTGVIAALLLDLVGVDYYDIVANYEVTHTYIRKNLHNILSSELEISTGLGLSKPCSIEMFLNSLYEQYGDAEGYLKEIGISHDEISSIKDGFTAQVSHNA